MIYCQALVRDQSERFVVWYFEVDKKTVWKILSDCDATAVV